MDAMVTARVPSEIREQGVEVLHEIGASTTDLVNAAFRYVVRERKLPGAETEARLKPGRRVLSKEQAAQLRDYLHATAPVATTDDPRSFEEVFDEAMKERYADLYRH